MTYLDAEEAELADTVIRSVVAKPWDLWKKRALERMEERGQDMSGAMARTLCKRPFPDAACSLTPCRPQRRTARGPRSPFALIVPSSPGGGTDIYARLMAQSLGETLKQQFVVENRPGASGNIGAAAVAKRRPTATPSSCRRIRR